MEPPPDGHAAPRRRRRRRPGREAQRHKLTKHFDKASISLWLACCTGQHFEEATLHCRKAGGEQEVYLKIKLKDAIISHYSVGGHSKGDLPIIDSSP